MKRSTSSGRGASGQQATDMLRIRKELIQSRSKVGDLQEELEEKTSLYLNAIKVRVLLFNPSDLAQCSLYLRHNGQFEFILFTRWLPFVAILTFPAFFTDA